jgi:hypothetical protein
MFNQGKCGFLLCVSILACSGCSFHEPNIHSERLDIQGAPSSLLVDVRAGDVRLRGADVDSVFVSAKIDGPTNHVVHEQGEDSLTVFDECHEEPCSVDLSLEVPRTIALTLRTGAGDVRLENARGDTFIRTGSGDITGVGLAGVNFSAETGSGDVRFEVAPALRVHLRTGSGDVALSVPVGAYRLDVSTGSGDQEIEGVSNDPRASGAIDVATGSGDLKITGI